MRPCTHCGVAIENNVRVCPSCRQEQPMTVGFARDAALDPPQLEEESVMADVLALNIKGLVALFVVAMLGVGYWLAGVSGLLMIGGMMLIGALVAIAIFTG